MQRWFYEVDPSNPQLSNARAVRAKLLAEPVPPVTGPAALWSPGQRTAALAAFAATAEFEMWGVATMEASWVYER